MVDWAISIISLWPEIGFEIISIFLNWCVRKEEAARDNQLTHPHSRDLACEWTFVKKKKVKIKSKLSHFRWKQLTDCHNLHHKNPHVNRLKLSSRDFVIMTNLSLSHCINLWLHWHISYLSYFSDSDRRRRKKVHI